MSSSIRKVLVLFLVIGFAMPVLPGVAQGKSPLERELLDSLKASEDPTASVKACTVSTEKKRSVALRVGPGTNRTSVAFLPTGAQFTVLGKNTDKSGKVWFKLDKNDAAPKSSAKELWVRASDVTTSGDCESAAIAPTPPVNPITTPAPPPPDVGSGNSAPSQGSIIPQNGMWTVSFARQTNASCEGTDNFVLNTSEVWADWKESDFVQQSELLSASPDKFLFNGTVFQSTGNNHYVGSWTFEDGKNTQLYLTVLSPNSMVGQMIGNGNFSGRACSATVDMSATKS